MKNILYVLIVIGIIAGALYVANKKSHIVEQSAVYTAQDVGIAFTYRIGDDGYVVDERMPVDLGTGMIKTIVITPASTAGQSAEGGELPPATSIAVFENPKKQFPLVWAQQNQDYSNYKLKKGSTTEAVVGGANAIRYLSDGLYTTDNIVVAHGDSVYVISGQFIDMASPARTDFEALVASINFVPKPNQQ